MIGMAVVFLAIAFSATAETERGTREVALTSLSDASLVTSLREEPLVRQVRRARRNRRVLSNSWITDRDSARRGTSDDDGEDFPPAVPIARHPSSGRQLPQPGSRGSRGQDQGQGQGGRNKGSRGRGGRGHQRRNSNRRREGSRSERQSRNRGGGSGRKPGRGPTRLDRRTFGLVYKLSNASTQFSVDLFSQLHKGGLLQADSVISPHSVHTALSMTSLGAKGKTQREISKTLGFRRVKLRRQREHRAYHALLSSLAYTHRDVQVLPATALFVKPNIPLEATFRQQVINMYLSNFATFNNTIKRPERAINACVANATRGQIPDLLSRGDVNKKTSMVLVTSLYLNASWAHPFDEANTSPQTFHSLSAGNVPVDMMNDSYLYRYEEQESWSVVEIPYKGERLAMYVVLPGHNSSVSQVVTSLAAHQGKQSPFDLYTQNLNPTFIRLYLPRFKIESETLDLGATLTDMGIKKAFLKKRANFGSVSVSKLYINKVFHQAVVEVKERGTTDTVASPGYFRRGGIPMQPTKEFRADRPFLFFIKDKLMNTILFLGSYHGQAPATKLPKNRP